MNPVVFLDECEFREWISEVEKLWAVSRVGGREGPFFIGKIEPDRFFEGGKIGLMTIVFFSFNEKGVGTDESFTRYGRRQMNAQTVCPFVGEMINRAFDARSEERRVGK